MVVIFGHFFPPDCLLTLRDVCVWERVCVFLKGCCCSNEVLLKKIKPKTDWNRFFQTVRSRQREEMNIWGSTFEYDIPGKSAGTVPLLFPSFHLCPRLTTLSARRHSTIFNRGPWTSRGFVNRIPEICELIWKKITSSSALTP